ncbi:MAG: NUDIX domain-containing protein [Candidatus Paceibacterota bacterium]
MLQVGVKVFIENGDGDFLLLRRSEEKYPDTDGVWDIPGGRIDEGSALEENLQREVREETGLELKNAPQLIYAQDIILNDQDRHIVRLTFRGKAQGEVELGDGEHTEFKWISLTDMQSLDDLDVYVDEILDRGVFS